MLLSLIIIAIGFALLIFGANWLVEGACNIAARLGVPERVAGLTIVAIGTSLPELVVSVTSAVAGHADMAFGNVMGSCLANLLLILGLSAVIKPVTLSRSTQRFEVPVSVAACGLLALLANTGGQLTQVEGAALLVAFGLFVARTVRVGLLEGAGEKTAGDLELEADYEEEGKTSNVIRDLLFIVAGIAMLKIGADFVRGVGERLGYPLVAKESFGSWGMDVRLAADERELTAIAEEFRMVPHLYQKRVGISGEDYRVLVVGGKAIASMKRKNEKDFRSNIEAGGKGSKAQLPETFLKAAERCAEILGLDYCGVDLLDEKGEPYVCEVNSNALFNEAERVTGVNVAGAYAEYILQAMRAVSQSR